MIEITFSYLQYKKREVSKRR